ncbi:MAG: Tripartite tricarboxylate transporter TctB family, partial [Deltaproteobacteria bacterium]|nr:Tripartite tricarboxylate transporter TctB family [Deltaproteobacteria bacterium]
DVLSGIFWLVMAILVCMESARVDVGSFKSPGPGFLPFVAALILGGFGIVLVINAVLKKTRQDSTTNLWKGLGWHKVIIILASLIAYAILLPSVGYLVLTFALMLLLFGIIERPRFWVRLVTALITVLATYLVFYMWLNVQLPKGLIDF